MEIASNIAEEENLMKFSSDTANKTIKNLQAEIDTLLSAEDRDKTYSYGVSEEPVKPAYSFAETQKQLKELRDKVALLRHAVNKFNISTTLEGFGFTVDEALGRMSMLHREKSRLYALLQVPEKTRVRSYGSREADFVCRNFDIEEVKAAYDAVCEELMQIQQAINVANLTITFEVEM